VRGQSTAWLVAAWAVAALGCGELVDPAPYLAAAERYDVRILRDPYGVPHVYGERDADVAYGLAYAHCEDDFATIQSVLFAARGSLARHVGRDAAAVDYLVHLLGIPETVAARYERDLSPATRAVVEAYADGVNHFAALHPDERLDGLLPVSGRDVIAGFALKVPFFFGLDEQIRRIVEGRLEALPDPKAVARYLGQGVGSNAVAVAPQRTPDGATRLLVNSHQPLTGPVAWYEIRLKSEEGWNVAGGTFPGGPVMLHGHNRNLGWANTVNRPDLIDVYALVLDPDDPGRYRLDGEWRRLERREVGITVKLIGPLRWTFRREVLRSEHGPVLRSEQDAFALRYAGMGEIRAVEQLLRLNKARDFHDWHEAMRLRAMPSTNFVYADRTGRIAYFYNARFPRRLEGLDWSAVLPGDRSDLIWRETLPLEAVPQLVDPVSGVLVNANHTPFRVTVGEENPRPGDFSPTLGIERGMTNRAWRALELFGADESISREEFRAYKFDHRYSERSDEVTTAQTLLALEGDDPLLAQAQTVLRAWDRTAALTSRSAALAVRTLAPLVGAKRRGRPTPDPRETLLENARSLLHHFGRLDPTWGEVNRLRRGSLDLPVAGGPDTLRAIEGEPDDDGRLHATGGDGLVMFVEWDADGRLRSESIHHFGAAMTRPRSPHYADQSPLYAAERTTPVLFEEADLRRAGAREYRPGG
jgi:penicillin amidase/acyl-homoserine-lactone acylase